MWFARGHVVPGNPAVFTGGAEGTRTPDPLHAMQVRYQLRHSPKKYFDGKGKYSLYALAVIS